MKFCSHCGSPVTQRVPEGDHRLRYVCDRCNTTHYQNPKIVAGCIAEWDGRILMAKRGINPRLGLWTLPAGFMENEETTEQAAVRETQEETRAEVQVAGLYSVFSIPHISQVYMFYRGQMVTPEFGITPESTEIQLMTENEVPWDEIAFPVVRATLKAYFEDRAQGQFPLRTGTIVPHPR